MSFHEFLDDTIQKYIRYHGRDKFTKVLVKVMSANKPNKLIALSKIHRTIPTAKIFLACICETPYFLFVSNETQALAALLLLNRWDEEVNRDIDALDDEELISIGIAIFNIYDIKP